MFIDREALSKLEACASIDEVKAILAAEKKELELDDQYVSQEEVPAVPLIFIEDISDECCCGEDDSECGCESEAETCNCDEKEHEEELAPVMFQIELRPDAPFFAGAMELEEDDPEVAEAIKVQKEYVIAPLVRLARTRYSEVE